MSENAAINTRNITLDVAKGLLMICVVAGHIGGWPLNIGSAFYYFHLQAFFFISGYLFNFEKYNGKLVLLLNHRRRMYFNYICYCLIFIVLHNVFLKYGLIGASYITTYDSVMDYVSSFIRALIVPSEPFSGALWFVPVLIIMQIIFYSIKRISFIFNLSWKFELLIITILFVYGMNELSKKLYPPLDFRYIVFLPFFYAGYIFRQHSLKFTKNNSFIAACFIFIIYSLYRNVNLDFYYDMNPFELLSISFVGIFMIIGISSKITNGLLSSYLSFIGERTIHILALHFFAFKLATYIFVSLGYVGVDKYLALDGGVAGVSWSPYLYLVIGVNVPIILNIAYTYISKAVLNVVKKEKLA